ncbi:MAG: hypothetical protein ABSA94_19195 [Acidobacteriaceae bacterium]|jgi:hypothetical protein
MDQGITKVIKQLREKRADFLNKAKKIEETIVSLTEVFSGEDESANGGTAVTTPPVPISPREYAGMLIGSAAVAFLSKAGTPQKTRLIADALEAGGLKSADMYRAVYNALDTGDAAEQDEEKRWRLRVWAQG